MQHQSQSCIILSLGELGGRSKSLCEVAFHPLLGWAVDAVKAAGIERYCVVSDGGETGKLAGDAALYQYNNGRLQTGHAVLCAKAFLEGQQGHTLVLWGDAPFVDAAVIRDSLAAHIAAGNDATVLPAVVGGEDRAYAKGAVACWYRTEKLLAAIALDTRESDGGDLDDLAALAARGGAGVGTFDVEPDWLFQRAGDNISLMSLNTIAAQIAIERHLINGVNFLLHDGIIIGPRVTIEAGATILPGTILRGDTSIGAGSTIGPNSILDNCIVGKNVMFNASQGTSSSIGDGATVGPFTQLRPDSHLGADVKVGDFVEIKNSTIGEGTSVAHLTYVGDADVGRHCNFGCGVVFVNYDGENKNRTTVGDYAFIGCNTNLVAPVTVGERAYTAAGTTVTQDVPDGAMAIGRARQENKADWAAHKLEKYVAKKNKKA